MINSRTNYIRKFSLTNCTGKSLKVALVTATTSDAFPATVRLSNEDADNDVLSDEIIESVFMKPFATYNFNALLVPEPVGESKSNDGEDSIQSVRSDLSFNCQMSDTDEVISVSIPVTASLCLSILSIDDDRIEFNKCVLGNTYVRDFQIWNRSECPLYFRLSGRQKAINMEEIIPANVNPAAAGDDKTTIAFQDFDNNTSIALEQSVQIQACSSKRIRTTFRAKLVGDDEYSIAVENVNNSLNCSMLYIHTSVMEKQDEHVLVLEPTDEDKCIHEWSIDFGNCHYNVPQTKKCYIKNTGKTVVRTHLESFKSTKVASVTVQLLDPSDCFTMDDAAASMRNHELAEEYCVAHEANDAEEEEDKDADADVDAKAGANLSVQLINPTVNRLRERYYESAGSSVRSHMPSVISYLYNKVVVDKFETNLDIVEKPSRLFCGSGSGALAGVTVGPRVMLDSVESGASQATPVQDSEAPLVSYVSESFTLDPGARKLVGISWTPLPKNSTSGNRSNSLTDARLKMFIKHHVVAPAAPALNPAVPAAVAAAPAPGGAAAAVALIGTSAEPALPAVRWVSSLIVCESRCCAAVVTLSADEIDFGECSIGEMTTEVITIKNESALPLLLVPRVESESISLWEREVLLEPNESKLLHVEYVARRVNTNYRRKIFLYNVYDPAATMQVAVKAKNVDTHQILLHSIFYKIYTGNHLRYVQINMENCVYNTSNLKIFSIRNIYMEPLVLRIGRATDDKDVRLFHIKYEGDVLKKPVDDNLLQRYFGSMFAVDLPVDQKTAGSVPQASSDFDKSLLMENMKWGNVVPQRVRKGSITGRSDNPVLAHTFASTDDMSDLRKLKTYGDLDLALNSKLGGVSGPAVGNTDVAEKYVDVRKELIEMLRSSGPAAKQGITSDDMGFGSGSGASSSVLGSGKQPAAVSSSDTATYDMLRLLDSSEYPFLLWGRIKEVLDNSELGGNDPSSSSDDIDDAGRVRVLERILSDVKELMVPDQVMTEMNLDDEFVGNITIPVKRTYHFAVLMQPSDSPASVRSATSAPTSTGGADDAATVVPVASAPAAPPLPSAVDVLRPHFLMRTLHVQLLSVDMQTVENYLTSMESSSSTAAAGVDINTIKDILPFSNDSTPGTPVRSRSSTSATSSSLAEPVKIRSINIRARAVRSEMTVSQETVAFGKTMVGVPSTRAIIITNNSSIPLYYSISKSGSISSGFIIIERGRKGFLAPYGSKTVELVFKPALHGVFEETMVIHNILDKTNTQHVVVKAKVAKPEAFQLLPYDELSAGAPGLSATPVSAVGSSSELSLPECKPGSSSGELPFMPSTSSSALDDENTRLVAHYRSVFAQLPLTPLGVSNSSAGGSVAAGSSDVLSGLSGGGSSGKINQNQNLQYIGEASVGEPFPVIVTFKVRNVSSKPREFVIDANHAGSCVLQHVPVPPPPPALPVGSPWMVGSPTVAGGVSSLQSFHDPYEVFEDNEKVDQSIGALVCDFEQTCVQYGTLVSHISAEERKNMEDLMEFYQQKLRIATRKGKQEKIDKYTKKIKESMALLSGETTMPVAVQGPSTPSKEKKDKEGDEEKEKEDDEDKKGKKDKKEKDVSLPLSPGADAVVSKDKEKGGLSPSPSAADLAAPAAVKPKESNTNSLSGATVFQFVVPPEHDSIVKVRVTVMPGSEYKYFKGSLPFSGYFRVFESRNEDMVKTHHFNMLLSSANIVLLDASSTSEATAAGAGRKHFRAITTTHTSNSPSGPNTAVGSHAVSPQTIDNILDDSAGVQTPVPNSMPLAVAVSSVFVSAPAPWSSFSTKELYGRKWDHAGAKAEGSKAMPENICNMSLKLVQAGTERAMQGSITISSLMQEDVSISICIDSEAEEKLAFLNNALVLEQKYELFDETTHGNIGFSVSNSLSVSDDSATPYQNKVEINLAGRSSTELLVQWKLSEDWNEMQQMILGYLCLRILKINNMNITPASGASVDSINQYIPVVCSWQHLSVIKVDRKLNFGDVTCGHTAERKAVLTNLSETQVLNYRALISSKTRESMFGSIGIASGQAGAIAPTESVEIPLVFTATAVGKHEEQLWVSNLDDRFDQKWTILTANVTNSQTHFVNFPDLVADETGKIKLLDLGLIQLSYSAFASSSATSKKSVFPYRIANVSGKDLMVTAITNLKKQCYIYGDPECTTEASLHLLRKNEVATLYIVIKPTVGEGSKASGVSKDEKQQQQQQRVAVSNVGALLSTTRALQGGIRFVFFVANQPSAKDPSSPSAASAGTSPSEQVVPGLSPVPTEADAPVKLFETSITFRGTVGCTALKVRVLDSLVRMDTSKLLQTRQLFADNDTSCDQIYGFFVGRMVLSNPSSIFPINYRIGAVPCYPFALPVAGNKTASEAVNRSTIASIMALLEQNNNCDHPTSVSIILENETGTLKQNQEKVFHFICFVPSGVQGLSTSCFDIANVDTGDRDTYTMRQVFDQQCECNVVQDASVGVPLLPVPHVAETSIADPFAMAISDNNQRHTYEQTMVQLLYAMAGEAGGSSMCTAFAKSRFLVLEPLSCTLNMNTPIWLVASEEIGAVSHANQPLPADLPVIAADARDGSAPAPRHRPSSAGSGRSERQRDLGQINFKCVGSATSQVLCKWSFSLNKVAFRTLFGPRQSVRIFPVSNLPITILHAKEAGEDVLESPFLTRRSVSKSPGLSKSPSRHSMSEQSLNSMNDEQDIAIGGSYGDLVRCGDSFHIFPDDVYSITAVCKVDSSLDTKLFNHWKTYKRLLKLGNFFNGLVGGKVESLRGTVAFMEAKAVEGGSSAPLAVDTVSSVGESPVGIADTPFSNLSYMGEGGGCFHLPDVVAYYSLNCGFVQPVVKLLSKATIVFRKLKYRERVSFEIKLENCCDVAVSLSVMDLPSWLSIGKDATCTLVSQQPLGTDDTDSVGVFVDQDDSEPASSTSTLLTLPPRSVVVLPIDAVVHESQTLESDHMFKLQPVENSTSCVSMLLPIIINVHIDIDTTKPLFIGQSSGECNEMNSKQYCNLKHPITVPARTSAVPVPAVTNSDHGPTTPVKSQTPSLGAKTSRPSVGAVNLEIKNQWEDCLRVGAELVVHKGLKESVDLQLQLQFGGTFQAQSFDLMPNEKAEFKVSCKGTFNGRVSGNHLLFYDLAKQEVVHGKNMSVKVNNDGTVGPVLLGTLRLRPKIVQLSSTGQWPVEGEGEGEPTVDGLVADADADADEDGDPAAGNSSSNNMMYVDLIGFISPAPTAVITTFDSSFSGNDTVTSLMFYANSLNSHGGLPVTPSPRPFDADGAVTSGCFHKYYTVKEQYQNIRLINDSVFHTMKYKVSSQSCRRVGMRLVVADVGDNGAMDDGDDFIVFSDTVRTQTKQAVGNVPPEQSKVMSLYMDIGSFTDALNITQKTLAALEEESLQDLLAEIPSYQNILAAMWITISDISYPLHPPCKIPVILVSNMELPFISTKNLNKNPISSQKQLKMEKQKLQNLVEDLKEGEVVEVVGGGKLSRNASAAGMPVAKIERSDDTKSGLLVDVVPVVRRPVLRLRGVSPCSGAGTNTSSEGSMWGYQSQQQQDQQSQLPIQCEINVGQHGLSAECLEWVIGLENCSATQMLNYRISTLYSDLSSTSAGEASDYEWALLNQSGGVINPEATNAVVLYFQRLRVGYFFTYITLENLSNPEDVQVLRVSMEIVQNWGKKKQALDLTPLFRVYTSVNQRGSALRQLFATSNVTSVHNFELSDHSKSLVVDYRTVCQGKRYKLRSMVLINTTDMVLEMILSSTFRPSELSFLLSVHTSKPITTISLGPYEKKDIFISFTPTLSSTQATDSERVEDSSSSSTDWENTLENVSSTVLDVDASDGYPIQADSAIRRPKTFCRIEGEVYISCRLMKDHHETVKILADCIAPQFRVVFTSHDFALKSPVPTQPQVDRSSSDMMVAAGPVWILGSSGIPFCSKTALVGRVNGTIYMPKDFHNFTAKLMSLGRCKFIVQVSTDSGFDAAISAQTQVQTEGVPRNMSVSLKTQAKSGFNFSAGAAPAGSVNHGRATTRDGSGSAVLKWTDDQFICVNNTQKEGSVVVAISGFMKRFGVCVVLREVVSGNEGGEPRPVENTDLSFIVIPPGECVWLYVFPVFNTDYETPVPPSGSPMNSAGGGAGGSFGDGGGASPRPPAMEDGAKIPPPVGSSHGASVEPAVKEYDAATRPPATELGPRGAEQPTGAGKNKTEANVIVEEFFTIYNRHQPAEKYRVPVRLLIETSVVTGLVPTKPEESTTVDSTTHSHAGTRSPFVPTVPGVSATAEEGAGPSHTNTNTNTAPTPKDLKRVNTEPQNILRHFALGGKSAAAGAQSAFASLEAAVAGFIRRYTRFWKVMMFTVAESVEIKLHFHQLYQTEDVVCEVPKLYGDYSIAEKVALACELLQSVDFLRLDQDTVFFATCVCPSPDLPVDSESEPHSPVPVGSGAGELCGSSSPSLMHDRANSESSSIISEDGVMCDGVSISSSPRTVPVFSPSVEMIAGYIERRRQNLVRVRTAALQYVSIFFEFLVLADYLTLNACRQHVHGYRATTTHTGQPAARLAQLFFTFVFKHFSLQAFMPHKKPRPVHGLGKLRTDADEGSEDGEGASPTLPTNESAECLATKSGNAGDAASASGDPGVAGPSQVVIPPILQPYGRTFVAFMNFLPDLGGSADALIKLCEDVQDALL